MGSIDMEKIKKVHCVGIGGIGVSAIAKFFNVTGKEVSGSDAYAFNTRQQDLEKKGIKIFIGHRKENVSDDVDLIIYSSAVPKDNPELLNNITKFSYTEALGQIMASHKGIAVSGTNGKTTTTAMLGKILEEGGLSPFVIVGGQVSGWDGNLLLGKGDIFVVEACEYKRGMMNMQPKVIVLTNIEEDHLDYYKDIEDIKSAFIDYVKKLPEDGLLVYNKDDENTVLVADEAISKKISYAIENEADLIAQNIIKGNGFQSFELLWQGNNLGNFKLYIPGVFNIYNALGAIATAISLGVSYDNVKKVVELFSGTWRRFEKVGEKNGVIIISDYAHHPTAVRETINGAKNFYPSKKILAVFEPHQKDRTIKLFDDFVKAFDGANEAILSEIYEVAGRNEARHNISSRDLVSAIKGQKPAFLISYAKNLEEAEKMVREKMSNYDVVLVMGAGDIYQVAENLVK